jgi:DNA polymerase I-like protein with 3'-5' exonuclease and polymerase domains
VIDFELVRSPERLAHIAQEIESVEVVGLDIETTAKEPRHGFIRLVQLNTGRGVYVIDLFATKTLDPVVEALRNGRVIKVIQHAKFEQKWFLAKYGLVLWPIFDTFRASYMLHNGREGLGHNLYDLYRRELQVEPEAPDLGGSGWSGPLTDEQYRYAAEDVVYLLRLRESLRPKLVKAELLKACLIEFGSIIGESEIENNGFRLDADLWLALARTNETKAVQLQRQLDDLMPHPKGQISLPGLSGGFNLRSNQQVIASLHRLGLRVEDTRKETLAMVASRHKAVPLFMQYRQVVKRVDSFGEEYLKHIDPQTGRIHTSFWPLTGAGRYSSSAPNLQQVPRSKDYRGCFLPGLGKKLIVSDYSQIELRVAAEISMDPMLLGIYKAGEDAHLKTASIIAAVPPEKVTKEQRQAAKPVNFGLIYGLGAEKLVIYSLVSYGVVISLAQAKEFIRRYFEGYAGVKRWHERALRDFQRLGMVRTLSGRLRYLDPKSHGEIFNTPVQGTNADGLKASLPLVYHALQKYGGRAKLVHMVHDELVVEVDDDAELVEVVKRDVADCMQRGAQPFLPHVPVLAEPDVGASWAAH